MRGRGWWVRVMGKEGVSRREGAGEGTRHCVRRSFVGRSQPRPPPAGQTAHNTHTGELVGGACNAPARTTEGRRGGNSTAGAASGALADELRALSVSGPWTLNENWITVNGGEI